MEQLELLWNYQQADSAADKLEKEIKRSPTRQRWWHLFPELI